MVNGSKGVIPSNLKVGTHVDDGMMRGLNGIIKNGLENELQSMLMERHNRDALIRGRDLEIYHRSGSAPPTVEGSLSAVESLFRNPNFFPIDPSNNNYSNGVLTEEEIRSHPTYLVYYYSNENLNPRLPPPLISKEDWRVAQRFQAGGLFCGIEDWGKQNLVDGGGSSLFSMQPGLAVQKAENELIELRKTAARNMSRKNSADWTDRGSDGSMGVPVTGMGVRRKSFADILQEGLDHPALSPGRLSRAGSHNSLVDIVDTAGISKSRSAELVNGTKFIEALDSGSSVPGRVQNLGSVRHSFSSAVGSSLLRSRTPESHLVGRSASPGLPPLGSRAKNVGGSNDLSGLSFSMTELTDVAASLSDLLLSNNGIHNEDNTLQSQVQMGFDKQPNHLFHLSNGHRQILQQPTIDKSRSVKLPVTTNYSDLVRENGLAGDRNASKSSLDGQVFPRRISSSASLHSRSNSPGIASSESSNVHYQADNSPVNDLSDPPRNGYSSAQKRKAAINNNLDTGVPFSNTGNRPTLRKSINQPASDLQSVVMGPHHIHHLQRSSDYDIHAAAFPADPSRGINYLIPPNFHGHQQAFQKAYLEAVIAQQRQQYDSLVLGKAGPLNHQYYRNPAFGVGMPYQGNRTSAPPVASGNPMFQNEQIPRFTSILRSSMGGSNMEGRFVSSLLEEIRNNKTRSYELSDVVDHVVEFSTDQYGSRFIQQKLETATVEEKMKIWPEIIPHALSLMTNVFGNYVIQKFFEHGSESQQKELAGQLIGHVLTLSLQMYGCRVIQKAVEVVDVDRQSQMVAELEGSVMKCVRDQNGNHVIQKCIERVSQDRIQFIISAFFGQVVALSTHPYGCRVIQRVLEHCNDKITQQTIMDEIMNSVCTLAQDQYGNYVIQHVLQHGKPSERSVIIGKLAGQIVKMSQQKFASNVVEKCLTFGGPEEHQLLVNEMLGTTDDNEPLQAMMTDPFGNYVVQKVLETCDDQSRELILSRIKVHLNALKRYTYGKHIVSRIEKLITAGERQIALS